MIQHKVQIYHHRLPPCFPNFIFANLCASLSRKAVMCETLIVVPWRLCVHTQYSLSLYMIWALLDSSMASMSRSFSSLLWGFLILNIKFCLSQKSIDIFGFCKICQVVLQKDLTLRVDTNIILYLRKVNINHMPDYWLNWQSNVVTWYH